MSENTKPYLDERVIYVFIRQDVEVKHQIVQALHAMRKATMEYAKMVLEPMAQPAMLQGIPFLTTVGMPDAKSMDRVIAKLQANSVDYTAFLDTDYEFGVIGVVTEPLPLRVREKPDGVMCNYRLWNPINNTLGEKPALEERMVGFCSACDDYVFFPGCKHFTIYARPAEEFAAAPPAAGGPR